MGAPIEFCSKRGVVAVLASGVVISLTALTGGITPALAKPDDQVSPTTTVVVPEPEQSASEPETKKDPEPEKRAPQQAPQSPQVPQTPVAPVAPVEPVTPPEPATPAAPAAPAAEKPAPVTEAPAPAEKPADKPAEKPATEAPAPKSQAPKTTVAPPVTSVETEPTEDSKPAESTESEATTAARTPATSEQKTVQSESPERPESVEAAETPADSPKPSAALAPDTEASKAPETSADSEPSSESTSESATSESDADSDTETPTVSITEAAKKIETLEPETVEAPEEDVRLARAAKPIVEPQPAPASQDEVAAFSSSIESSLKLPGLDVDAKTKTEFGVERRDVELVSQVRQWRPEWIEYDEYYRPIFMNPFRAPVRIVYMYEFAPRIVIIPPLARMVIEAARYAAYSFTAAVLAPVVAAVNTVNAVVDTAQALTNIAVGSFFGGGYFPGVGLPLPAPPPPVLRYDNVPVFVNYAQAQYEPFRVRQIVDVGDDPQFGERKVLLDGATPAWGVWTQTPSGERQFEVHRTQQFPGLDAPAQGPLPGDYKLRLLSDEASDTGFTGRDIFLFVTAGVIGTLGFGAIGLAFFMGRRRPEA
jgi:hypothetical protein